MIIYAATPNSIKTTTTTKNKMHTNHNHKENRREDSAEEINKQTSERSTVDRRWVNGLEHKELKPK